MVKRGENPKGLVKENQLAEFWRFIETGHASDDFFKYLNEDEKCQQAIDLVVADHARSLVAEQGSTRPQKRSNRLNLGASVAVSLLASFCLSWGLYQVHRQHELQDNLDAVRDQYARQSTRLEALEAVASLPRDESLQLSYLSYVEPVDESPPIDETASNELAKMPPDESATIGLSQ